MWYSNNLTAALPNIVISKKEKFTKLVLLNGKFKLDHTVEIDIYICKYRKVWNLGEK